MAGTKRDRQRESRQAKLAALAAARRHQQRKRTAIWTVGGAVVIVGIIFLFSAVGGGGKKNQTVTAGSSTTVAGSTASTAGAPAATGSAAGKPCVALADPLPAGAPAVPVEVGPPPTQLITKDLKPGTGADVAKGATVTVNYIGVACSTGKIFDSSYSRNQPATFPLTGVIKGWTDGIPGMKVGGQRLLGIPAAQAYGTQGSPPNIAPDEALWFVVEVLDTKAG